MDHNKFIEDFLSSRLLPPATAGRVALRIPVTWSLIAARRATPETLQASIEIGTPADSARIDWDIDLLLRVGAGIAAEAFLMTYRPYYLVLLNVQRGALWLYKIARTD